jgi:hypothetical protein
MLEDLLELITSILGSTISTTFALASACPLQISMAFYTRISFHWYPSQQFSLLKRTLDERPAYSHGRDAFISASVPVRGQQTHGHIQLRSFFQQIPNLRTLSAVGVCEQRLVLTLLSENLSLRNMLQELSLRVMVELHIATVTGQVRLLIRQVCIHIPNSN